MSKEENPIEAKALVAVGTERLATLLAEVAVTNPGMRRRLQFEHSNCPLNEARTLQPPLANGTFSASIAGSTSALTLRSTRSEHA